MSTKFGLPTYPISNGMDVGYNRSDEELDWLLDHGYFKDTPVATYYAIRKDSGLYGLLTGSNERHLQHKGEECLATFESLRKLADSKVFNKRCSGSFARWQWFEKEEEE